MDDVCFLIEAAFSPTRENFERAIQHGYVRTFDYLFPSIVLRRTDLDLAVKYKQYSIVKRIIPTFKPRYTQLFNQELIDRFRPKQVRIHIDDAVLCEALTFQDNSDDFDEATEYIRRNFPEINDGDEIFIPEVRDDNGQYYFFWLNDQLIQCSYFEEGVYTPHQIKAFEYFPPWWSSDVNFRLADMVSEEKFDIKEASFDYQGYQIDIISDNPRFKTEERIRFALRYFYFHITPDNTIVCSTGDWYDN